MKNKYVIADQADFDMFSNDVGAYAGKLQEKLLEQLRVGMTDVTIDLLGESVNQAPRKSGAMADEALAAVDGAIVAGGAGEHMPITGPEHGKVIGEVSYQTVSEQNGFYYPWLQETNVAFNHPNGGKDHFLRDPVEQNIDRYVEYLSDMAKKALRGDG